MFYLLTTMRSEHTFFCSRWVWNSSFVFQSVVVKKARIFSETYDSIHRRHQLSRTPSTLSIILWDVSEPGWGESKLLLRLNQPISNNEGYNGSVGESLRSLTLVSASPLHLSGFSWLLLCLDLYYRPCGHFGCSDLHCNPRDTWYAGCDGDSSR